MLHIENFIKTIMIWFNLFATKQNPTCTSVSSRASLKCKGNRQYCEHIPQAKIVNIYSL